MSAIRYIIEVIICSGLFLVAYRWLLAKKVSFGLCRAFIMTSMLLAVAIPAMNVPVFPEKTFTQQTVLAGFNFIGEDLGGTAAEGSAVKTEGTETVSAEIVPTNKSIDIKAAAGTFAIVIYIIVALASLTLTIYNIIKIQRLRRRSKLTHTEEYTLAEHEDVKTPFSFLMTIFMGFNYEPDERKQILTHESSHVRHRHSFERISLSVLRSVFWFNPFFWMIEKDLEEVQEWEADKDVLSEGYELNRYRTTIFKQLFGYNPDISCGLNHSLTKQRFIMMTQSRRGKGAWIRLAATLPVIAAVFIAFGCGPKTNLTNGTEATYIPMCPPCDASVSNSFGAGTDVPEEIVVLSDATTTVGKISNGALIEVINDPDGRMILIDGVRHSLEEIAEVIGRKKDSSEDPSMFTVHITAFGDARMGIMIDIKEKLRTIKGLRIVYTSKKTVTPDHPYAETVIDEYYKVETYKESRNNIIVLKTNSADRYLIGDRPGYLDDTALERVKGYILNKDNDPDLPSKTNKEFTLPDGRTINYPVSQAMILMQNDRGTSFEGYQAANAFVQRVYRELRDDIAGELFGRPLAELSEAEMSIIRQAIPMNVCEAEPKDVPARN